MSDEKSIIRGIEELVIELEKTADSLQSSGPPQCPAMLKGQAVRWAAQRIRIRLAMLRVELANKELARLRVSEVPLL